MKYHNESIRLQNDRNCKIETGMRELLSETKEIKQHLMEYNFLMKMDTVDLSDYLPFQTDDDLHRFMKRDDEWNQQRKVTFEL